MLMRNPFADRNTTFDDIVSAGFVMIVLAIVQALLHSALVLAS